MPEVLTGQLEHVRLASLLQLVEGEVFTGWLALPGGRIGFHEGRAVQAEVQAKAGALQGPLAISSLFLVPSGTFRLHTAQVQGAPLGSTLGLVMEGVRVADEWDRLAPLVLAQAEGFEVEPDEVVDWPLLDLLDGQRAVIEAVDARGAHPVRVLDRLLKLLDEGWLVEAAAPRPEVVRALTEAAAQSADPAAPPAEASVPAGPSPEPAEASPADRAPRAQPDLDYDEALLVGRKHLRSGAHVEAEAAFRAALAARPGDRIAAQNLKRALLLQRGDSSRYDWFRSR